MRELLMGMGLSESGGMLLPGTGRNGGRGWFMDLSSLVEEFLLASSACVTFWVFFKILRSFH